MPCRTILYTGKGGVGKTSVAAATARRCAAQGARTLVVSTDPAHSLGDVLERELGADPVEVEPGLWAHQVTAQAELEANWSQVQAWAGSMMVERGVDRITADELTVPPGADELFALLAIKERYESGAFDVVVVDCAPTGETLRLLAFPDVARWWLDKVFPQQGRLLDAARPIARAVLDLELPGERVLDEVRRLVANMVEMHEILRDREHVTVRLVMNPDRMVVDEARRTFTYLNLYGFLTDAVVVNRVFPEDVGPYFAGWRATQQEAIGEVDAAFAPVPVLHAPYFDQEVRGDAMLDRLGDALFEGRAVRDVLHATFTQDLDVRPDGATLRLSLPFARKDALQLKRIGDELVVRVGPHKRTMLLPPALAGYRPSGATFDDDALVIEFHA
ncbi:MAG TPA: ArsA family ATPase [Solirubrobacteraceae bacterium]|nr:ArsA family ATPase [Solirubrobacteraceae bacterium]